jgi:hypothetical protein
VENYLTDYESFFLAKRYLSNSGLKPLLRKKLEWAITPIFETNKGLFGVGSAFFAFCESLSTGALIILGAAF